MGENSIYEYLTDLHDLLARGNNTNSTLISNFFKYAEPIMDREQQDRYSEPMPWIGIYITLASLFCILAMVADLLHGLKNRKLWFPCNYFTLNAASLSVIAVAIKLPMDLNNSMRGDVDQAAKLGSMAFMCTMMANLLPSLATMDNKELLSNIIALVVLVITLVVNVCIQIKTGVVSIPKSFISDIIERFPTLIPVILDIFPSLEDSFGVSNDYTLNELLASGNIDSISFIASGNIDRNKFIALSYVVMTLALLIIHICSALTILRSKQILEPKYKAGHERALKDLELQTPGRLNVEKLNQLVSRYWIMAGTGSPQFMAACSATTTASGVICAASTLLHSFTMLVTYIVIDSPDSDYKWSIPVIFRIQFIGVVLGTIAPLSRCFASLSFKMSKERIWEHIKVFKVESYWTQKLDDWKQSSIPFPLRSRKFKVVIENSKFLILSFGVGIQKTVVVVCKMMALIPIFFMACVFFCSFCWKWLKVKFGVSATVKKYDEQQPQDEELREYVLQLQDGMEPAGRTLKSILKSMNRLIKKAENQPPKNLMNLLKESGGFQGVEKFDSHHVPPLLLEEYPNCWSLPLVTLTAIAISLPNIEHKKVGSLVNSVGEGMLYVTLVEESLNATGEYVRIEKAAKMLWLQVDVYHKWLGNKLKDPARKVKTTRQILVWFRDTSEKILTEMEGKDNEGSTRNSFFKFICATSMYRITQTILLSYQDTIDALADTPCFPTKGKMLDQEELFVRLSSMISDILAVCFTNLPQVIAMRCHTSVIEKMEASVYAAAQLLGETTQIINRFEDQELPSLDPDESMLHPFP